MQGVCRALLVWWNNLIFYDLMEIIYPYYTTKCVILGPSCGDPGTPFNGRRIGDDFSENAIIQFFCNAGFTLVGASVITCESDQWSAELPQCSGKCISWPYMLYYLEETLKYIRILHHFPSLIWPM